MTVTSIPTIVVGTSFNNLMIKTTTQVVVHGSEVDHFYLFAGSDICTEGYNFCFVSSNDGTHFISIYTHKNFSFARINGALAQLIIKELDDLVESNSTSIRPLRRGSATINSLICRRVVVYSEG